MNDVTRQFRDFFVSLKLTVVLLVLGMLLVFGATFDQVNLGVWGIQQKWFRSFFVLQNFNGIPVPVFPGGYFIGGLLLINLIASHVYRFKFTRRKLGIALTHIGLILLLVGELMSGLLQEDYSMAITEGQSKNYAEHFHNNELAIVDTSDPATDRVVAIPEKLLGRGEPIQHAGLPFRVIPRMYYPNALLEPREGGANEPPQMATTGIGQRMSLTPLPITYAPNQRNLPGAFVELVGSEGTIGTWMVSSNPNMVPQRFEYGGKTWTINLRFERSYKPFTLTLLDFSHDRYAGTNIPKNFSSRIRLTTPEGGENREVLIYMNNPLRYAGLTFYQASFDGEHTTVLQVVRNPSWLMPYIACALMTLGLLIQFGIHLVAFVNKRRPARAAVA